MKLTVYNEIIALMHKYKSRDSLCKVQERYPNVSLSALGSIFAQDYQKKMRKTHHLHYNPEKIEQYYQIYCKGVQEKKKNVLYKLANEVDLSPALLARIILERSLSCEGTVPSKSVVTRMMKDTSLIEDPVLPVEIHTCIVCDDHYGPLVDNIKHSIGHEYEFKLNKILDDLGLAYIGEDQMRDRGYDKTPDIKLEIPISVDGYVVNWIESKASFGDEHSHKGYLKDQFWSYWNRFGPGMVIYWFGFIDELDVNKEKGIILRDSFPENIVKMNPLMK
ncbi:hypothetical protein FSP39_001400 [Pinctada imbricata]|uniref:CDAN1-interacting nuclease 1 n=1 Tax=Pinctada imbricata TaxID=66713 RepID=A0AA88Y2K9_PINIB|nr:hypothetical protein FSP39_001400 [Pinctada imbricata]